MPLLDPGFANRVGRWTFFFILVKVSLVSRGSPLFDISLVAGKRNLFPAAIVITDSEKAQLNQRNEGYDLTNEPQTLEALQNSFILISWCEIYPYYGYILST